MQAQVSDVLTSKTFNQAGLPSFLCKSLQKANFIQPTPIQYHSIQQDLHNPHGNLVARSKSGTGKTIAFLSILLKNLITDSQPLQDKTYSVILLPTRELAVQVYQTLHNLLEISATIKCQGEEKEHKSKMNKLRVILTIGGISFEDDRKKYREQPCHIVISTVGRLWEMLNQHVIILHHKLILILDEGDKLLCNKDDKFARVLGMMSAVEKRWLVFSATYTAKVLQQLKKLLQKGKIANSGHFTYLHTLWKDGKLDLLVTEDPEAGLNIQANGDEQGKGGAHQEDGNQQFGDADLHMANIKKFQINIHQSPDETYLQAKISKLREILANLHYKKCLIFVEKKSFLEQIAEAVIDFDPLLMHGSLSQAARFRMMNQLNKNKLILSSDLLARGIDIRLDLVILFDARQTDNFWHRIGRTGRYGRAGVAISLDQLQDKEWKDYNQIQVNHILDEIDGIQEKSWFGTHLTQVGKWVDVDPKIEQQNNYKYYQPPSQNQVPHQKNETMMMDEEVQSMIEESDEHQQNAQNENGCFPLSFTSQQQFKTFLNENIFSCQKCTNLIEETTSLTGYQFQILKYMSK